MTQPSFTPSSLRRVGLLTAANFLLRLCSLAGKLLLSLYMARFLGLRDLGEYGLAFGCVMIAAAVFGLRLDYVLAREIADFDPAAAPTAFQSTSRFYLLNFVLCAPPALFLLHSAAFGLGWTSVLLIYSLCCLEAYGNLMYEVLISLDRSTLANVLIFVRGGLWTIVAMVVSWLFPGLRNAGFVLQCWLVALAISVAVSIWYVRGVLMRTGVGLQASRAWLKPALQEVFMVWLGSVAVTVGAYLDRFVLAQNLSIDQVGVASFYLSFTWAVLSLIQSSTLATRFPRLVVLYKGDSHREYIRLFRNVSLVAAVLSATVLIVVAVAVPILANLTQKAALSSNMTAFGLLLGATWIRTHAESFYYMLYVERKNAAVWTGNVLFLLTSFGLNMLLIPYYGIAGLGAAAMLSATMLLVWRCWFAVRDKPQSTRQAAWSWGA
jgi:O-antigen/teichoic acid export membrane protein